MRIIVPSEIRQLLQPTTGMDEEDCAAEGLLTIVGRGEEGVDAAGEAAPHEDEARGLPEVPQDQRRGARITA